LHKDLKADFVLANPPFNDSDWHRGEEDVRWKYGLPPKGNANFAWVQHFIHHLSPNGYAGFVLANGSMSSNQSGEGDIRKAIVEADLVDCMVALPGQLFYSTQIPVCLWFLARNKGGDKRRDRKERRKDGKSDSPATSASSAFHFRDRRGKTLFIDARKLGVMIDRVHRELTDEEIKRLADTYHNWQSGERYKDTAGFCKSATKAEIAEHGYVLTPGRYVGAEEVEDDDERFEGLGYQIQHGPHIAPGEPAAERGGFDQVVLEERLQDAILRLNSSVALKPAKMRCGSCCGPVHRR